MWSRWNEPIKLKKVLYITCIYIKNPSCIQCSHAVPNPPSSHLSVQFQSKTRQLEEISQTKFTPKRYFTITFFQLIDNFQCRKWKLENEMFFSTESFGILKFHAVSKRFFVDYNGEVGKK